MWYHWVPTKEFWPTTALRQMGVHMITIPELVAQALGSFLTSETKSRFGSSHARLAEVLPFAARLTLDCIANSDALYHNVGPSFLFPPPRPHFPIAPHTFRSSPHVTY